MGIKRLAVQVVAATCLAVMAPMGTSARSVNSETAAIGGIPCSALTTLELPQTVITAAVLVPAQGPAPDYCRVLATVEPETDIEVRLPTAWHERLLHLGGSGLDGVIPNLDGNLTQLTAGYAVTASNGGHRDPTRGPTRFLDNPTLVEDYAHVAIEKTVRAAKAVIGAYYGRPPSYSYFSGCSAGGRGALNAAAHYGDEFDGVVAGAPTRNTAGMVSRWADAGRLTPPPAEKLASMYQAQLAQCDGLDGLVDGIISHPAACDFDPASLRCVENQAGESCLTDQEIDVIRRLRTDLTLDNGRVAYDRFGIGNPATGFGVFMPLGGPGTPTFASFLAASFLSFIVYNDPTYDFTTYDLQGDLRTVVDVMEHTYDFSADTTPLAQYLRSGKKVIVWQGTEDTLMSHIDTIRSYETMASKAGHHSENARLYTLPGVQHCGGGPGANRFDMIAALADWVENDLAPHTLVGWRTDTAGNVLFTRPLCEFPRYPRYDGHGDPNEARSFRCVAPAHGSSDHD
jgi:Tannase and feruloyl esterase